MKIMKRLFFVSLILVTFWKGISAQELSKMNPAPFQNTNKEDWRVILQFIGPSQWSGGINAVKPISKKWFIRVGASPIISFSKSMSDNFNEDDSYFENISRRNIWGASLGLGTEYHFNSRGRLDPFIGIGSNFGFSFLKWKSESFTDYSTSIDGEVTNDEEVVEYKGPVELNISPFGSFGINYFISPRFAIGAEYGVGPNFTIENGTTKYSRTVTQTYSDGTVEVTIEENTDESNNSNTLDVGIQQRVGVHFIYVIDRQ